MLNFRCSALVSAGLVTLAAVCPVAAQERFSSSGAEVVIYNIAGQVRVEPTTGSAVVMELTRVGPDASRLKVENGRIRGRDAIRVIYPDERIVYRRQGEGRYSSSDFRVRDDGTFDDERLFGEAGESGRAMRGAFSSMFGEGHKVTVAGGGRGLEAHADLRVLVPAGKRVAVILGTGKLYAQNIDGDIVLRTHSGDVSGDRVAGRLSIESGSGDIKLSDATARVDIHTGSGDVDLLHMRGTYLSAETGSGDVKGTGFEAARLVANTGSGDIELRDVRSADVTVETGSGDVELGLLADITSLRAHTGSGDVTISVPTTLGAAIAVDTGSGDVDTELPLQATDRRRSHLRGTIGDGRGDIRVETGSGDVHLIKS